MTWQTFLTVGADVFRCAIPTHQAVPTRPAVSAIDAIHAVSAVLTEASVFHAVVTNLAAVKAKLVKISTAHTSFTGDTLIVTAGTCITVATDIKTI